MTRSRLATTIGLLALHFWSETAMADPLGIFSRPHSCRLSEFDDACDACDFSEEYRSGCDADSYCDSLGGSREITKPSCLDPWLPRSGCQLPFLKERAEERGFTLPLPLGVSVISTVLRRRVSVDDVRVGLGTNPPQSVQRVRVDDFDVTATNEVVRGDVWLLPCLNVYGLVGHTRSRGSLVVNLEDFPTIVSPDIAIPIDVRLSGFTYGGGATVAVGTKRFFASLDVNYTRTDFDQLASELFALVMAPRFGVVVDRKYFKGEFHVGAMYQDTEQTVDVILSQPPLGTIRVAVDQVEREPWNFLVGTLWGIDERLHLLVELGLSQRKYVISGLTVRF